MPAQKPLIIEALAETFERPVFAAACEFLAKNLGDASGDWPVILQLRDPDTVSDGPEKPDVVVLSLIGEVTREEPIGQMMARLQTQLSRLSERGPARVLLCTVFRHVANSGPRHGREAMGKMERIRRLNLMAAQLSHDTGVDVIDTDRILAHIGARSIKAGYRLAGRMAADAAGYTIALVLLEVGLDEAIPDDIRTRALEILRGSNGIFGMLARNFG